MVTGTIPQATAAGKFFASIPAENDTGNSNPSSSRNRCMRVMEITCRGGPERYMYGSAWVGKMAGSFWTTRVFVNLAPTTEPRRAATDRQTTEDLQSVRVLEVRVEGFRPKL